MHRWRHRGLSLIHIFVELWRFRIRACVFLQHIKLGCQDIEVALAGIFNLDIILDDFVHSDLLYAPVNTKAMIFMDYIVAYIQLGKALDLLSAVLCLLSALFLLLAENVGLGDQDKLDQGIFKSPLCVACLLYTSRCV